MRLVDWKTLRPIPRLPPPSDGRRFSLSQWERAGVRVNGHPTSSAYGMAARATVKRCTTEIVFAEQTRCRVGFHLLASAPSYVRG